MGFQGTFKGTLKENFDRMMNPRKFLNEMNESNYMSDPTYLDDRVTVDLSHAAYMADVNEFSRLVRIHKIEASVGMPSYDDWKKQRTAPKVDNIDNMGGKQSGYPGMGPGHAGSY